MVLSPLTCSQLITMDPELGFSNSLNGCWSNYLDYIHLGSGHSGEP